MMQFNMYHHYTVDEHLLRCIGILSDIEAGRTEDTTFAIDLMRTIQPRHRELLYVALFLHDIAKGRIEDHSIAGARVARRLCPRLGFSAAETETVAWLVEQHLLMSIGRPVARPLRPQDDREFRRGRAVGRADEAAHHSDRPPTSRRSGPASGTAGRRSSCARSTTRPSRCSPAASPRSTARSASPWRRPNSAPSWPIGRRRRSTPTSRCTIPPTGSRSTCRTRSRMRASCVRPRRPASRSPPRSSFPAARGVTELTVLAPDHPWLLSMIAGACAAAGANIVDAQIFTTTDGRALDTIAVSREFELDDDEARRAARIAEFDREGVARRPEAAGGGGEARDGEGAAQGLRGRARGDHQQRLVEPLHRGRGHRARPARPALRADRDAVEALLNIASAHVATFGERVVDVFYVTDLFGAKITSATRQATIKRALITLLSPAPAAAARPASAAATG